MIHDNSRAAYAALPLQPRQQQALGALIELGGLATDRQIAHRMGSGDPNTARPRITKLIQDGLLREAYTIRDRDTGRKVRVVGFADAPQMEDKP